MFDERLQQPRKTLTGLYPSNKEPRYLRLHRTFDKISILGPPAFVKALILTFLHSHKPLFLVASHATVRARHQKAHTPDYEMENNQASLKLEQLK